MNIQFSHLSTSHTLTHMLITLSATIPRPAEELKQIPFKKGLRLYFFFAYFLFVTAGLGLLSGTLNIIYMSNWKIGIGQAFVGTALFTALGLVPFYLPSRKKLLLRRAAFEYGELAEARVTKQYRKFVAWKSARDWMIDAEIIMSNGKKITGSLQTSKYQLGKSLSPGTKLQALWVKNQGIIFLPLEIGVQVTLASKK